MNDINISARKLRKIMTPQERKLWSIIKNRQFFGFRFRRQYPIDFYIADFICREKRIIIEIDGGQHNQVANMEYDNKRTEYLVSQNYKVIRFWNNEIDNNINGVYEKLKMEFEVE